jgi:hypothetical protein
MEEDTIIMSLTSADLVIGGKYNFKYQPEKLIYVGYNWSGNGHWHQFEKENEQGIWCEIQTADLMLLEKRKEV